MIDFESYLSEAIGFPKLKKTVYKSSDQPWVIASRLDSKLSLKGGMKLGAGIQSTAFGHKEGFGHHIHLVSSDRGNKDNPKDRKHRYLDLAARFPDNPHLPKIDRATDYESGVINRKTGNPEMVRVRRIEKLAPLRLLNKKQLAQLHHSTFGEEIPERLHHDEISMADHIVDKVQRAVLDPSQNEKLKDVNPQLHHAIKVVQKAGSNSPGEQPFDIHRGNLMARNTPYGHQLVITDPLI